MLKSVDNKTTQTEEGDPAGSRTTSPEFSKPSGEDAVGKDWFVVENIKLRKQIKTLKGEYEKVNRNLSIRCQLLQNKQKIIPSDNFYLQLDKLLRRKRKGRKYKNSSTQTDITFMSPFFSKWESYFEDSAVNRISSDGEVEVLKRKRTTKRVSEIRYQYNCANEVHRLSDNQSANEGVKQRKYTPCGKAHGALRTQPTTNIFKVPNHLIHKDNVLYSLYTDNDLIFIKEIAEDLIPKGGDKRDSEGTNNKGTDKPSHVASSHLGGAIEGKVAKGKDVETKSSWIGNPTEREKLDDLLTYMKKEEISHVEDKSSAVVLSQDEERTIEGNMHDGTQTTKWKKKHDEMGAVKGGTCDMPPSGVLLPDEENKHGNKGNRSGGGKGIKEHPIETDQILAKREKYIDVLLKHEKGSTSPDTIGTMLTPQEEIPHGGAHHSGISPKWREAPTSEKPMQSAKFVSSPLKKKEAPTSWDMSVGKRAPIHLGGMTTTRIEHTGDNATAPLCDNNPPFTQKNRKKKNKPSKQIRLSDSSPLSTEEMVTRMEPSKCRTPLTDETQRTHTSDNPWVRKTSYPFVKSDPDSYKEKEKCPPHGIAPKKGHLPPLWDSEHEETTPPLEGCHHSISLSDAEKSANEIRKISLEHKKRAFLFYM
ncbi:conserved Plasmodium protein, unknown function [Plasmodium knowlesi strain H]|uniref:Uncharacterized protein n=3 Tax=Plasmodium knowlesi TaxID=5850 RepID=A0A5K1UUR1_PLAKH|nr:conserved Plasmodium protein, unknown function [Plasmodium knowlesi strain H]OTN68351.1 Uncharacterized protein PKNOH_S03323100 [Plasmodium knowlesi]CAA9987133.1 conserved Plasmodium protein, unknown function [Plasmodium knowlesi strain H]SBO23885.1 conserved Plasmodium protein, unknown function [Plasmodium knowlesi strain H]SBO25714.1 conserved Plasmodium protein, unknown function [Plasmodium knowlesi strain H]VVS76607.1 conserved Plasmodium protein, unknown function [Plasmodium knowlesi s|eukprot:XP_002261755.1 hypothetical protein, conserved in Plasmodium species [Plasmodium knowlesi strain H]